ncbi:MAG: hypothetical protein ACMUIA_04030 [bacterium]
MDRYEIRSKIIDHLKQQLPSMEDPDRLPKIQIGYIYNLLREPTLDASHGKQTKVFSIAREIIQELINNGILYVGNAGDQNSGYPWLTITEHGKEALTQDDWLPYDPDGYMNALKEKIPCIDSITLAYMNEAVTAYSRRQFLSATLLLGVASENLILLLIKAYLGWMKDPNLKASFEKKVQGKRISMQYKELKEELATHIHVLPQGLQDNWKMYLDGIFSFIRLSKNDMGYFTAKKLDAKLLFAHFQVFVEYAGFAFDVIALCGENKSALAGS